MNLDTWEESPFSFSFELIVSADQLPCFDVSSLLSTVSIRRSGISHSSAPNTYRPKEIHCHQKANGMAAAYSTADSLPFQSPAIAFLRIESGPCDAMISCCNIKYATAAIRSTTP